MAKDLLARLAIRVGNLSMPHTGSRLFEGTQLRNTKPPQATWAGGTATVKTYSGVWFYSDHTIIQVHASSDGGSITFNLELRATFTGAGSDLIAADLVVADGAEEDVLAFTTNAIPAGYWVRLDMSACDPGVTAWAVTLVVQ